MYTNEIQVVDNNNNPITFSITGDVWARELANGTAISFPCGNSQQPVMNTIYVTITNVPANTSYKINVPTHHCYCNVDYPSTDYFTWNIWSTSATYADANNNPSPAINAIENTQRNGGWYWETYTNAPAATQNVGQSFQIQVGGGTSSNNLSNWQRSEYPNIQGKYKISIPACIQFENNADPIQSILGEYSTDPFNPVILTVRPIQVNLISTDANSTKNYEALFAQGQTVAFRRAWVDLVDVCGGTCNLGDQSSPITFQFYAIEDYNCPNLCWHSNGNKYSYAVNIVSQSTPNWVNQSAAVCNSCVSQVQQTDNNVCSPSYNQNQWINSGNACTTTPS